MYTIPSHPHLRTHRRLLLSLPSRANYSQAKATASHMSTSAAPGVSNSTGRGVIRDLTTLSQYDLNLSIKMNDRVRTFYIPNLDRSLKTGVQHSLVPSSSLSLHLLILSHLALSSSPLRSARSGTQSLAPPFPPSSCSSFLLTALVTLNFLPLGRLRSQLTYPPCNA